jgi:hypothetical protein
MPLLSQTAAGHRPDDTPRESQPWRRQAVHESLRSMTYGTLQVSHVLRTAGSTISRRFRAFGALAVALNIYDRLQPTFPDRFDAG